MQPYRVLREMMGDRFYVRGDTRLLSADDAAHLMALGLVEPIETPTARSADGALQPRDNTTAQHVRASRRKNGA
jgi:hypothetical protein